MLTRLFTLAISALLAASCALARDSDPFPRPLPTTDGAVLVAISDFATIPDSEGGPPRLMLLLDEPGTGRLFVSDMKGLIYSISRDGQAVTLYLDLRAPRWDLPVQASGAERGLQSFAFHPQFGQPGTPGYGKFYTYLDTSNQRPVADFVPATPGAPTTHDTVLLEWMASDPSAARYEGRAPRELIRLRQPFANHNAGHLAFNPLAAPGSPDFGLLYMGVADGGSGGDPMEMAQNLGSAFGKILRIDPLGTNSANGKYGIPAANPFVTDTKPDTLGEIYAYGVRNPQRFGWDSHNGNMFTADIGQNIIEEVSQVTRGANLGWNDWEGSYRFISRTRLDMTQRRVDPAVTYPVAEYDHTDGLFPTGRAAITGLVVYRGAEVPQLSNTLIFGDNPSGEVFYVSADQLPDGGQDAIGRVLFNVGGSTRTLLQLINARNASRGRSAASRVDLRFGTGPNNQIFLLNKQDGMVRVVGP